MHGDRRLAKVGLMQWEYLKVGVPEFNTSGECEATMNDFGEQGWELVSATPTKFRKMDLAYEMGWGAINWLCWFKRPKREDEE
jgi:hypothetical protein